MTRWIVVAVMLAGCGGDDDGPCATMQIDGPTGFVTACVPLDIPLGSFRHCARYHMFCDIPTPDDAIDACLAELPEITDFTTYDPCFINDGGMDLSLPDDCTTITACLWGAE